MLEILWKGLFFLSMLILYANVTSVVFTIALVIGFAVCVSSYYYSKMIQGAIDEFLQYFSFSFKFPDNVNQSQVNGFFMNKTYNKIISNGNASSVNKKIFSALCNTENAFLKDARSLDNYGPSAVKTCKTGELPSPIMKSNLPVRNKVLRDKLKITFNPKEAGTRKNGPTYNSLSPSRKYNSSWNLETYMNVNSPGFTSRVVDKATESASYHIKYPAVRHVSSYKFDKSVLRQISIIPRANSTPAVGIVPPEMSSVDLITQKKNVNEPGNENGRSNNILQVLKDMSRKRNYTQEATDRSGSTPKKSRKHEVRTVISQCKRAHEDCSNDSIEVKSRKKRCDDSDYSIVKMMSYTSSLSVLSPEDFTWSNTQSKKRKSSKLEKLMSESPEKVEKFRKISEDLSEGKEQVIHPVSVADNAVQITKAVIYEQPTEVNRNHENAIKHNDEAARRLPESSFVDEDSDYVRVVGGKILNRNNRTYRRKLNNSKIDPISLITSKTEYVTANINDENNLKENLLKNLINDIERKEEKSDSVIFYQSSIVEEVSKNIVQVDVHQTDPAMLKSSTLNPLLPITTKPSLQFDVPTVTLQESTSSFSTTNTPPTLLLAAADKLNPSSIGQNAGFTFGMKPIDVVDASLELVKPLSVPELASTSPANPGSVPSTLNTIQSTSPILTTTTSLSNYDGFNVEKQSQPRASTSMTSIKKTVTSSSSTYSFGSTSNFTFGISTDKTTIEKSNLLLSKNNLTSTVPSVIEPSTSSFGSIQPSKLSATTTTQTNLFQDKTIVITNSSIPEISGSVCSSNAFNTSNVTITNTAATLPIASGFSAATQACTVTAPFFLFNQSSIAEVTTSGGSAFNFGSFASTGRFKFGTSEAAEPTTTTTSGFNTSSTRGFSSVSTLGAAPTSSFDAIVSAPTTANNTSTNDATLSFKIADASSALSFNFGSVTTNSFGTTTQSSIFNNPVLCNTTEIPVLGNPSATSVANNTNAMSQPSVFGNVNNQPVTFGISGQQSDAGTSAFPLISSSQANQPASIFGGSSQVASAQTSLFTASEASGQMLNFVTAPQTTDAGDAGNANTANLFGQIQGSTPPVGVVNPLPQTPQLGGSEGFVFGASCQQPTRPTYTHGASMVAFGSGAGSQSAFNPVPLSPFNFLAAGAALFTPSGGNAFTTAPPVSCNGMFNFGGSNATLAPPPPSFQFGTSATPAPTQPIQPFMFGAGATVPAPTTGRFSIGSGGTSARVRAIARSRKGK